MPDSNVYIKNMVCKRCIKVVTEAFVKLGLPIVHIELGKVVLEKMPNASILKVLEKALNKNGFEVLLEKQQQIIEQVKTLIIEHVHHQKNKLKELDPKYKIKAPNVPVEAMLITSWWDTYKPILLIFLYIFLATWLVELTAINIDFQRWMRHFMAGFFLVFSFFKMLNLKDFKETYRMYDVIAKRFPAWGYIYAFTELLLGIAFLTNFNPLLVNSVTLLVMSVSIIGVLQTVLQKKTIKCACLGAVFNLPMSTVTVIEDGLMIAMSLSMLLMLV